MPAHCRDHSRYGVLRKVGIQNLVLPDAYHLPTVSFQSGVVALVPGDVRLKLGTPISVVGRRHGAMLMATMPVASVHEDGYTLPTEDYIRTYAAHTDANEPILPESQTRAMQQAA